MAPLGSPKLLTCLPAVKKVRSTGNPEQKNGMRFPNNEWALILGGSSGFGLAAAKKLAAHRLNVAVLHRDRRGAMKRIEPHFDEIRRTGVRFLSFNADALDASVRAEIRENLQQELGDTERIRLLLHSIALGNLKPLSFESNANPRSVALEQLAVGLGKDMAEIQALVDRLFGEGADALHALTSPPDFGPQRIEEEDLAQTIYNMGTSILSWVHELLDDGLFAADARILGLTSEGNTVAWRGYAAIAAAKVAMESLSRSMALELAPHGLRSNVIQAGITETPASTLIPGIARLKAQARLRNPFGRLTTPEDVAGMIFLMCTDEATWVNGSIIRVDGGEHISGGGH